MLAHEREKMQHQLMQWGYLRHRVERMKPWSLLSCYQMEKTKREGGLSKNMPSKWNREPFLNSALLSEIWTNNLIKTARQKMVKGD